MPVNKNAMVRYQVIDRCLRNPGRKYYIEELIEECNRALKEINHLESGVQRRQIFYDLRFMESSQGFSAPIEKIRDGRRTYYRYDDLNFSINNQPINELEAEQIRSALQVLSRFRGMPQFEWVNEIIPKIQQSFKLMDESEEIIGFDSNVFLKGVEHIGPLFNAILYKRVLTITYKPFGEEEAFSFTFHPYYLKQYNNRWFVFGWSEEVKEIRNPALDRIEKIEETDRNYRENQEFHPIDFFEDIIGVSRRKGDILKIKIKADNRTAPYIETKPLHGSQKVISRESDGIIFSYELIPNIEFYQQILFYGETVEIIEPAEIRDEMKEKLKKAFARYSK